MDFGIYQKTDDPIHGILGFLYKATTRLIQQNTNATFDKTDVIEVFCNLRTVIYPEIQKQIEFIVSNYNGAYNMVLRFYKISSGGGFK